MSADRDLAEAIYAQILSDSSIAEAVLVWDEIGYPGWATAENAMRHLFGHITQAAIDTVLARRLREAARTGPWGEP